MKFEELSLSGNYLITPDLLSDERGGFSRYYCTKEFAQQGISEEFVQFNHSYNKHAGTLRGLHFQTSPHEEGKLIKCIRGSIVDVIVDIRPHSKTYLKHIKLELSELNRCMVYIAKGMAHGFQTLEDDTEVIYHHTAFYEPQSESGILYNDPALAINWPLPVKSISQRDLSFGSLIK